MGWTSIYQLFWGSLGTRVLTHPHMYDACSLITTRVTVRVTTSTGSTIGPWVLILWSAEEHSSAGCAAGCTAKGAECVSGKLNAPGVKQIQVRGKFLTIQGYTRKWLEQGTWKYTCALKLPNSGRLNMFEPHSPAFPIIHLGVLATRYKAPTSASFCCG